MLKKYALEIYSPGCWDDVLCSVESDTPFLPIQKGDVINPRTWSSHYSAKLKDAYEEREFGVVLKVVGIEHFIVEYKDDFTQHKLGVFTTVLDDVKESRLKT